MALHPGSLSEAYEALREHGFSAGTMRNACERAAYGGSFTIGRATVTFDRENGYRVTTAPLPPLPVANPENVSGTFAVSVTYEVPGHPGGPFQSEDMRGSWGECLAFLAAAQLSEHKISSAHMRAVSCASPAHADELAAFGDCASCGEHAPAPVPAQASAAEAPGTIANACAFGWGA